MRFIRHLYMGKCAKKHRISIIRKLKTGKFQPGVHVICPAACKDNLLDIIPSYMLLGKASDKDLQVVGIAASKYEAYEVCRDIVMDVYDKTSAYDIRALL